MFRPLVEASAGKGALTFSAEGDAVAVWLPLAIGESPFTGEPIDIAEYPHLAQLATLIEYTEPRHPIGWEHLYLPFLGVAATVRGTGIGGGLLTDRLTKADTERVPAYLEASSARNRSLYLRHGFVDHGEPITLPSGPRIWPMWRTPK
ncbi:GNAT family N-acetyltransferase [Sciscionella sediminilitoris]|uniref:GNAT family N-acetyltransferase n=1 Tax=Sciscionella sediminilitoris TaxID=1445613 RepID=UPI0012E1EE6A|nr:GNAT family N-acetyltransferase [Sciscionella sp. SE31]